MNVFTAATRAARSFGYKLHARPLDGSNGPRRANPRSRLVALGAALQPPGRRFSSTRDAACLPHAPPPLRSPPLRSTPLRSPPAAGAGPRPPAEPFPGPPAAASRSPWRRGWARRAAPPPQPPPSPPLPALPSRSPGAAAGRILSLTLIAAPGTPPDPGSGPGEPAGQGEELRGGSIKL